MIEFEGRYVSTDAHVTLPDLLRRERHSMAQLPGRRQGELVRRLQRQLLHRGCLLVSSRPLKTLGRPATDLICVALSSGADAARKELGSNVKLFLNDYKSVPDSDSL